MAAIIEELRDRVETLESELAYLRERNDRFDDAVNGIARLLASHAELIVVAVGNREALVCARRIQVVDAHGRVVIQLDTGDDDEPRVHLIHRNVDGEIDQVQENNLFPNKHRKE